MTPVCPRLLNMITDFVLLRFWARASEHLSAIEVILLLLLLLAALPACLVIFLMSKQKYGLIFPVMLNSIFWNAGIVF